MCELRFLLFQNLNLLIGYSEVKCLRRATGIHWGKDLLLHLKISRRSAIIPNSTWSWANLIFFSENAQSVELSMLLETNQMRRAIKVFTKTICMESLLRLGMLVPLCWIYIYVSLIWLLWRLFDKSFGFLNCSQGWQNERAFTSPLLNKNRVVLVLENDSPAHRNKVRLFLFSSQFKLCGFRHCFFV